MASTARFVFVAVDEIEQGFDDGRVLALNGSHDAEIVVRVGELWVEEWE